VTLGIRRAGGAGTGSVPAGVVALGARIWALGVVGVLLIAGGIVLVRSLTNSGRPRDLALALAMGGCIASYTLVDKLLRWRSVDASDYGSGVSSEASPSWEA
jgi:hypothetical protein